MKKFYFLSLAFLAGSAFAQTQLGIQRHYTADLGRGYEMWADDYDAEDPESPLYVTSDGVEVSYVEGPGVAIYQTEQTIMGYTFLQDDIKNEQFYCWCGVDPDGDGSGDSSADHVYKVGPTLAGYQSSEDRISADTLFVAGQYFGFDLKFPEGKGLQLDAIDAHFIVNNNFGYIISIVENGREVYNSDCWLNKQYRMANAHIGDSIYIDHQDVTGVDKNIAAAYPETTIEESCCPKGGHINRIPEGLTIGGTVNVKVYYCWPREREEGVCDETTDSNKPLSFDDITLIGEIVDYEAGISNVNGDNADCKIYNIMGQPVKSATCRQISIMNGKKVIL